MQQQLQQQPLLLPPRLASPAGWGAPPQTRQVPGHPVMMRKRCTALPGCQDFLASQASC